MKLLLLVLCILLCISCNQQTLLYGSGTIITEEYPLKDSITTLSIELDARPVAIVKDTVNKISFTTDDNLLTAYSFTYDSLLQTLNITKSADQQLLTNAFTYTIHLKTSPKHISVSNCTLSVDEKLDAVQHLSAGNSGRVTVHTQRDSLALVISDQASIAVSGQNKTQDITLNNGASYSFTESTLYSAWVQLTPSCTCTLAVEKYIYGSIADHGLLAIKGSPLVETVNETKAKVTYIE